MFDIGYRILVSDGFEDLSACIFREAWFAGSSCCINIEQLGRCTRIKVWLSKTEVLSLPLCTLQARYKLIGFVWTRALC